MTLAEAIYRHSLNLPEQAAQEALDFIEFLEQRYQSQPSTVNALPDEKKRKAALAHIASVRIHWEGKPIQNRDALYDDARS